MATATPMPMPIPIPAITSQDNGEKVVEAVEKGKEVPMVSQALDYDPFLQKYHQKNVPCNF